MQRRTTLNPRAHRAEIARASAARHRVKRKRVASHPDPGEWEPAPHGDSHEDMKRVVREQRLGFYGTGCARTALRTRGSPKGTTHVLDDDHLFFADIRSPKTVANIRRGSLVEVNIVDPLVRKGYRFNGKLAAVHWRGASLYDGGLAAAARSRIDACRPRQRHCGHRGARGASRPSPAYDYGNATEADVIRTYQTRFARLHEPASS